MSDEILNGKIRCPKCNSHKVDVESIETAGGVGCGWWLAALGGFLLGVIPGIIIVIIMIILSCQTTKYECDCNKCGHTWIHDVGD
jgi:predicted nucleic-acid-binding Zn-ribbon protein